MAAMDKGKAAAEVYRNWVEAVMGGNGSSEHGRHRFKDNNSNKNNNTNGSNDNNNNHKQSFGLNGTMLMQRVREATNTDTIDL